MEKTDSFIFIIIRFHFVKTTELLCCFIKYFRFFFQNVSDVYQLVPVKMQVLSVLDTYTF